MADILGCLKQLVDKKNENETFSARKVYICNMCGHEAMSTVNLQNHKQEVHPVDQNIECDE